MGHSKVHLVVLVHGLWGSPDHLAAAKEELELVWGNLQGASDLKRKTRQVGSDEDPVISTQLESQDKEEELVTMIAGGMASQLTYDGIDVCAGRVSYEEIERLGNEGKIVTHFSITGYSLGGLVARYLVGLLESRTPSFFDRYRPISFSTIATPHIGIPRYNTILSTSLIWLGSRLLSRSGQQLYVADPYAEDDPRPLLEIMADPHMVFFQGLGRFQTIQIFANGIKDHTVPYPSAAMDAEDHFSSWQEDALEVEADKDGIIRKWAPPAGEIKRGRKPWTNPVNNLPPVLRLRFPLNYLLLILFPVLLPIVLVLLASRLALDTRRSRLRLSDLAKSDPADEASKPLLQNTSGRSVRSLRRSIKRLERGVEAELVDMVETASELSPPKQRRGPQKSTILWKDSQLRMISWLNRLPITRYITWFPDVANSHAVIIVRDPRRFPGHDLGRGVLRRWAHGVLDPLAQDTAS